jgi:hypothetical protein
VTSATDSVLASIDGALTACGYIDHGGIGSSMRWRPEPPEPDPDPEWRDLDDLRAPGPLDDDRPGFLVTAHYRTAQGFNVCVRATVYTEAARAATAAKMAKARHPCPGWYPRPASRCGDCNPHGNPGPLAVNGSEYSRRRKARRRRKAS